MAKHAVEERLAALAALDLKAPETVARLSEALGEKNNLVVGRAAKLALKGGLQQLTEAIEARLMALLGAGAAADRGCQAKLALADALYQWGAGSEEVFRRGARHTQVEPVFGGHVDTAAELRGTCALGLVRIGSREALTACADLLGDREQTARVMGARALAYSGREEAVLPLRVKALCGDKEPVVTGECLLAILRVSPVKGIEFVARFLDDEREEVMGEAAMALGTTRGEEAYRSLRAWWDANPGNSRRSLLLLPMALTRQREAIDLLKELAESAPAAVREAASEALSATRG